MTPTVYKARIDPPIMRLLQNTRFHRFHTEPDSGPTWRCQWQNEPVPADDEITATPIRGCYENHEVDQRQQRAAKAADRRRPDHRGTTPIPLPHPIGVLIHAIDPRLSVAERQALAQTLDRLVTDGTVTRSAQSGRDCYMLSKNRAGFRTEPNAATPADEKRS